MKPEKLSAAVWLGLALTVLLALPALASSGKIQAKSYEDLDKIIRWLPADCETLVVFRKPFLIQAISKSEGLPESFGDAFRCRMVRLPLPMEKNQIIPKSFLDGKNIVLQVSASKLCRPANVAYLEGGSVQDVSIMVLGDDAVESLQDALALAHESAREVFYDLGYKVIVLSEYDNQLFDAVPFGFYFCSPASGILLCANNRQMMHEVLVRIGEVKSTSHKHLEVANRILPPELPEWVLVNKQADIWALRHYDKKSAAFDRSSPDYLSTEDKSFYRDEKAQGLVFEYSQSNGQAKISFMSDDPRAQELRKSAWKDSSDRLPVYEASQSGSVLAVTFDVAQSVAGKRWALAVLIWHLLGNLAVH
jgi:hypothetical protein